MIAVFVSALAALFSAALAQGRFCTGPCSTEWVPWADMGMVYYLVAAGLFAFKRESKFVKYYISAGLTIHLLLIGKMFFVGFCPACLLTAFASVYLFLVAFNVVGDTEIKNKNLYYAVLAIVLMTAAIYAFGKPSANDVASLRPVAVEAATVENGRYLQVYKLDGTQVDLDLSKKPALIFAWWCSHCDQPLKEVLSLKYDQDINNRTYIVGLVTNGKGEKENLEKAKSYGIPESEIYFMIDHGEKKVPVMFWYNGENRYVTDFWSNGK